MTKVGELRDRAAQLRAELLFAIGRGDAALVATGSNIRIAADVDEVLNAFHAEGVAEGEERLQKYTAEYLKEGIKRCDAALAQGRREGAEQLKADLLKRQIYCDMHGRNRCIVVPDFLLVLAPTKEEE